jgi:predicted dehydrogenase
MVLIEKPLAVDPSLLTGFSRAGVGFNLRFHPVIQRLAEVLGTAQVHTVDVYAGQYLGDWRPGRPVAEQYSSSRERGGGVVRDLSHEFDYLAMLFGPCLGLFARGGRVAEVTADADDAWGIVANYAIAPVVTVQINYLDSVGRRRIIVNSAAGTFEADLVAGSLSIGGRLEHLPCDKDSTYRAMHAAMLAGRPVASVAEASATDDVIAMVELSEATQAWVAAA